MWQPTLIGILQSFSQWKLEISRAVSADITPIERLETFLFTGFYLLIGLVMLVRGGYWVEAAGQALSRRGREQTEVWRFLISIGRLVLPGSSVCVECRFVRAGAVRAPQRADFGKLAALGYWLCQSQMGQWTIIDC